MFWKDWCAERGVDFVSLFPAFLSQGSSEEVIEKYYWKDDCHWNEEGQQRVAKTLFNEHRAVLIPLESSFERKRH
jgi:hypothetical protein